MSTSEAVPQSTQGEVVSHSVISAVAEEIGSEPESLEPLYHTIDPDALNALFEAGQGHDRLPIRVEFTYSGCDVVVVGDGSVHVEESTPGRSTA